MRITGWEHMWAIALLTEPSPVAKLLSTACEDRAFPLEPTIISSHLRVEAAWQTEKAKSDALR